MSDSEVLADEGHIRRKIEQLYENIRLTESMTDEPAKLLLIWGEQQISSTKGTKATPMDVNEVAYLVERTMRTVNYIIDRQADLSEAEMTKQLLKLADRAVMLGSERAKVAPPKY